MGWSRTRPASGSLEGATCATEETVCQGDVFSWCPADGQQIPIAANCRELGRTCFEGFCVDEPVANCTETSCDGANVVYCLDGNRYTTSCELIGEGFECTGDASGGDPSCAAPAAQSECQEDDGQSDRCDGDVAVTCVAGSLQRVDCAKAGATCTLSPSWLRDGEQSDGAYCEIASGQ